jgi:hypothetical protein
MTPSECKWLNILIGGICVAGWFGLMVFILLIAAEMLSWSNG